MDYRKEIDGLRALAVLPVIFFHAGFDVFGGGFVGVDVFFVISGYLITTIILADLAKGTFSVVKFYERRARRILPALFLVMLASLVVGYFTLMPDEFKNLGQSLVSTSLFSNNVLLALTSGYWELASEFKPLLHTWSLGVEEQYYLITPIALLFAWKYCKHKISSLLFAGFVVSFIFAAGLVTVSPNWAFYSLPTRAWEISIGGLAALFLQSNPGITTHFKTSNLLSLLGIAFIVCSVFLFDRSINSPGPLLLIPTAGAVLVIIFATEGTLASFALGQRAVVFMGLLSYSLYLWHQPVFAFLRAFSIEKPSTIAFGASTILVFLFAYLSWKYIETPCRNGKKPVEELYFWRQR